MRKKLCFLLTTIMCFSIVASGCGNTATKGEHTGSQGLSSASQGGVQGTGAGQDSSAAASAPAISDPDASTLEAEHGYAWPEADHGLFSLLKTYDQITDWDTYHADVASAAAEEVPDATVSSGWYTDEKYSLEVEFPGKNPEITIWEERAEDDQYQLFSYYQSGVSFDTPAEEICDYLDKQLGWQPDIEDLQQAINELRSDGMGARSLSNGNVFMKVETILGDNYTIKIETADAKAELGWVEHRMNKA